jgi:hypothetical protein
MSERSWAVTVIISASVLGTALNVPIQAYAADKPVRTSDAKCLLEVDGVHYLGGSCKFVEIDKEGSFRITENGGLGLIAQVNVSKKGEGTASYGPLGKGAGTSLGIADQSNACWSGGDSDSKPRSDFLICAWSPDQAVYLGPTPADPDPSSTLFWGSRVGMYDEIKTREGIGSSKALIRTAPSKDGVIQFCREYAMDYSIKCITEYFNKDRPKTYTANCVRRTFTDYVGDNFLFIGKNNDTSGNISADYLIRDLKSRKILDGSTASSYDVESDVFKALCPRDVRD